MTKDPTSLYNCIIEESTKVIAKAKALQESSQSSSQSAAKQEEALKKAVDSANQEEKSKINEKETAAEQVQREKDIQELQALEKEAKATCEVSRLNDEHRKLVYSQCQ